MKVLIRPLWLLAIWVAAFLGITGLLLLGARGNEIAGVLSLAVSVATFLLTFVLPPRSGRRGAETSPAEPADSLIDYWRGLSDRGKMIWNGVAVAALGAMIAAVFFLVVVRPTIYVTDLARLEGAANMADGDTAILTFAHSPSERDYLTLVAQLKNRLGVGNCVAPATLLLTPVVDGRSLNTVTARAGESASLGLDDLERSASVRIGLRTTDSACRVDLSISSATFNDWGGS